MYRNVFASGTIEEQVFSGNNILDDNVEGGDGEWNDLKPTMEDFRAIFSRCGFW